MKFSLPAALAIFYATTALAFPQNIADDTILARDDEGIDISHLDIEEIELAYDPNDFENLAARATIKCSNQGKIKRVKKEYAGKCHPNNSIGTLSAHNCKNRQGKSYLCVQSQKATCYTIPAAQKKNFEKGECFIRK
ncbi:uncharacterized protein CTRU02_215383 [Colletotrichum truncatum]|uniref:Uncharacterized protein n=1 Tax=Colletotrichum truncatum TaxID=5467 RepID=A0ACC3YD46_COLTU|nr:uncharacterized protein CTRU02_13339 [Colletotrichum truncatum]KAF6783576.1 hypothetical protein CTRU02_13339 [Colletotrichum truncatum]